MTLRLQDGVLGRGVYVEARADGTLWTRGDWHPTEGGVWEPPVAVETAVRYLYEAAGQFAAVYGGGGSAPRDFHAAQAGLMKDGWDGVVDVERRVTCVFDPAKVRPRA